MTELEPEQIAFVRILQLTHDYVEEWRHLFQGAMIRATTSKGRRVTVTRIQADALVSAGIVERGVGASFYLTDLGRGL